MYIVSYAPGVGSKLLRALWSGCDHQLVSVDLELIKIGSLLLAFLDRWPVMTDI